MSAYTRDIAHRLYGLAELAEHEPPDVTYRELMKLGSELDRELTEARKLADINARGVKPTKNTLALYILRNSGFRPWLADRLVTIAGCLNPAKPWRR